jgi:acyl dehydratase
MRQGCTIAKVHAKNPTRLPARARERSSYRRKFFAIGVLVTTEPMTKLYLEDLVVGMRFTSLPHEMTADAIKAFARQFDPQPFHLDETAAAAGFFKGLAASGWHTAAVTMRLLVEQGMPLAGGLIGAGGELTWPRPTRPGDVLTVESEILAVTPSKSKPERGLVTVRSRTLNQKGEVVQDMTTKMLAWRRTA